MRTASAIALLAALAAGTAASAQVRINELLVNPAGTDNGQEFFELIAAPGTSLSNLWLLVIEGEGPTASGVIDQAFNLSAFSVGSNGLFLWRDSAAVLNPAPDAGTTINIADFNPDIENGSQTYLLVSNFTGAVGNDLDANADSTLDSTPWTSVLDAIGYQTGATPGSTYAAQFGGITFPTTAFNIEAFARGAGNSNVVYAFDTNGATPGPYTVNGANILASDGSAISADGFLVTPGSANTIPGPAAAGLLALAGLVATRRRRA